MPAIVPFIPLIAAGITGGTTLGLDLSGAGQPSTSGQQKLLDQQAQQQAQQDAQARQKAILANLSQSQEQTGGNVNAPQLVDLASIIAGLPGQTNQPSQQKALSEYFGTPSSGTGSDTLVSTTYGLSGSQG